MVVGRSDGDEATEEDIMGRSATDGALVVVLVAFGLGDGDRAMEERDLKCPKGLLPDWGLVCCVQPATAIKLCQARLVTAI